MHSLIGCQFYSFVEENYNLILYMNVRQVCCLSVHMGQLCSKIQQLTLLYVQS